MPRKPRAPESKPKPPPKKQAEKRPVGRPLIGCEDLPDGWQKKVIEAYKNGASDKEVYRIGLGISYETFSRLFQENEEFTKTVSAGRDYAEAWFLKQGREAIWQSPKDFRNFRFQPYAMQMRNRFGWDKDKKQEIEEMLTEILVNYVQPVSTAPKRTRKK